MLGVLGQQPCAGKAAVGLYVLARADAAGLYEFVSYDTKAFLGKQPGIVCSSVCLAGISIDAANENCFAHFLFYLSFASP